MNLRVTSGDYANLSRDLDDAASEAATATLRQISSAVSDAMPGASAGDTMSDATTSFDDNLKEFADALTSDSEAAAKNDESFTATDKNSSDAFLPAVFDNISQALKYGR